jgi:hypothetical protein
MSKNRAARYRQQLRRVAREGCAHRDRCWDASDLREYIYRRFEYHSDHHEELAQMLTAAWEKYRAIDRAAFERAFERACEKWRESRFPASAEVA